MDITINRIINNITNKQQVIRNIHLIDYPTSKSDSKSVHDDSKLIILLKGQMDITYTNLYKNTCYNVFFENDLIFIPNKKYAKIKFKQHTHCLIINFHNQAIQIQRMIWDGKLFEVQEVINLVEQGSKVCFYILRALSEYIWLSKYSSYQQMTIHSLIDTLFKHLLALSYIEQIELSHSTQLYQTICHYIDHHFDENITRKSIAKQFYISPTHLSILFQHEGEIGLNKYINHVRIEYAKSLLRHKGLNIKEIAKLCGYNDSNYFCRLFHKSAGLTPSEYRIQYYLNKD